MISPHARRPIRVLVVDDHRSVLWGLGKLIESARPRIELADSATCRREALAAMTRHRPDIVLLDVDLGDENGLDLLPQLRDDASVIILSGARDESTRERAMLEGARGFIHKVEPAELILKAIAHVYAGESWLDRGTMGKLLDAMLPSRRPGQPQALLQSSLTLAERKVIGAVLRHKGAPNKVIAASLNISEHTVRNHLANIYSKLDIHHRLDLVLYAVEHKLGSLPS
jgi:two-component system, NarL family, nitrate/nitrite response regulator NarL